jgi:hypothetical protein
MECEPLAAKSCSSFGGLQTLSKMCFSGQKKKYRAKKKGETNHENN